VTRFSTNAVAETETSESFKTIRVKMEGHLGSITLNRPDSLNALSCGLLKELYDALSALGQHKIRSIVIDGAPRSDGRPCFSAGADLKDGSPEENVALARQAFDAIDRYPGAVIAAIGDLAFGGGLELALCCDFRIVARNARLALPEINIGSMPRAGGTQRLARLIGEARAKELLLTGEPINGARAYEIGLAMQAVDIGAELSAAVMLAERLSEKAPLAFTAIKQSIREGRHMPLDAALDLEIHTGSTLDDTEDRIEGRRAFIEKRPPRYSGS
jgi:enoyl-CoA hydratase/carnithine racemase